MKQKLLIMIMLYGVSANAGDVQPDIPGPYLVAVTIGINTWKTCDLNASPLIYRSVQKEFGIHFGYNNAHTRISLGLSGSFGRLFPRSYPGRLVFFKESVKGDNPEIISVPANGNLFTIRMDLGYHFMTGQPENNSRAGFGLVVSETLFDPNGFTRPALMNIAGINPSVRYELQQGRTGSFYVQGQIPLFSSITRLPWDNTVSQPGKGITGGFFSKGSRAGSWGLYQGVLLNMGYAEKISEKLKAGIDYRFHWMRIPEPELLKLSESVITASLYYSF